MNDLEGPRDSIQVRLQAPRRLAAPPLLNKLGAAWKQSSLLCLVVVGLSACAMAPSRHSEQPAEWQTGFQQFFADAPSGSSTFLAHSPWGAQVTVYAHESYYAASGRTCRKLTIAQGGMRRPGLVCRLSNGGWEQVTALDRGEHPLQPNSTQLKQGGEQ